MRCIVWKSRLTAEEEAALEHDQAVGFVMCAMFTQWAWLR
jgi:hypothetical protein